jgi:fluoroacetyl-CoA thioesterase
VTSMEEFGNIHEGMTNQRVVTVEEKHTVSHTKVPILSTPRMIALMESVSADLVHPLLPANFTTVGYEVNIRHKAPSRLGSEIQIWSRVVEVDGRKLLFEVRVQEGDKLIGEGVHRRTIVAIPE